MMALGGNRSEPSFFANFERLQVETDGVAFEGVTGGSGPALLLLHGYPQTHIAWRRIAPELAKNYRLVIPDLPGYGASRIFDIAERWTKRRVAKAMSELMAELGHDRFGIVGHDRGARVGYRLALDHASRVFAYASLTVVPTLDAMQAVDHRFALNNFHWFFLAQDDDFAERALASDPDGFLSRVLTRMTGGRDFIDSAAAAAYYEAFRRPSVRRAIIEDYRAAVRDDLEADHADFNVGRKLDAPVLVTWSNRSVRSDGPTPESIWRRWADDVTGVPVSGGHLQPEEAPDEILAALLPFLGKAFG
ncbi:alpha/beta fold hydrolase [Aliihoeflea sp. PC F10.4]